MKILDIIMTIVEILFVVLLVWGLISIGEIAFHNLEPNPQYSDWNLINNLLEWTEGWR